MDKRQEKTIANVYAAFSTLIHEKEYDEITVQDILDRSKVSRSTFYSHFKTKDDLLLDVSQEIFDHVFSHSLKEESSHDFSHNNVYDYKHLITHILYHILDEKELIKGILSSDGSAVFLKGFRHHLQHFCQSYFENYPVREMAIPVELAKSILVENFIVLIHYWISVDFSESPEQLTKYFVHTVNGLL